MRASALLSALALAAPALTETTDPKPAALSPVTLFSAPSNYTSPGVLYERTVALPNGDLLATFENYSPEPPPVYFPIYRSSDAGATWAEIARVQDLTAKNRGLRYQPFLYLLPEAVGNYEKGALFLAGNAIPTDLSTTQIELYVSTDGKGEEWEFVSHIASGGEAVPDNGLTPVWEPFLLAYKGTLLCFYSDQRANTTYAQKLVHQAATSSSLTTWGPVVDDVAHTPYTARPGMTTVALLPNGMYMMTYEYGGGPNPSVNDTDDYTFPVTYRIAADPTDFNDAPDHALVATDGTVPTGSPYVVWTPASASSGDSSSKNGTIIVSSGCCSELFVNEALGADDAWTRLTTPAAVAYSRSLLIFPQDPRYVLIGGAGSTGEAIENDVTVAVVELG